MAAATRLVEQPAFGYRVRQLRLDRGLTQAELAGDEMSASYVSLVESGHRTPGTAITEIIARRLNMDPSDLAAPGAAAHQSRQVALVGRLVAARAAATSGDYPSARDQLLTLIGDASNRDSEAIWWEARWELAGVHGQLGEHTRRGEVLRGLLEHRLTTDSVPLHTRVSVELSAVARHAGELADSARWAEHAVAGATTLPPTAPERVLATLVQLSAYADSGVWEPASSVAAGLLEVIDDIKERQLAGLASWSAGAIYFLADRAGAGELFGTALGLIDPAANLRLWGRLCRGAAAYEIAVGNQREAESLLARATEALELVGTPADRCLVSQVRLALGLRAGDLAVLRADTEVSGADLSELSIQDRARCLVLRARVARAISDLRGSAMTYQQAASHYEAAGAYRLATEVWHEYAGLTDGHGTVPLDQDHHALVMP